MRGAVVSTRRFPIGTRVIVAAFEPENIPEMTGTVIRHGRDAAGIHTVVRYDDGMTEKCHRKWLRLAPEPQR